MDVVRGIEVQPALCWCLKKAHDEWPNFDTSNELRVKLQPRRVANRLNALQSETSVDVSRFASFRPVPASIMMSLGFLSESYRQRRHYNKPAGTKHLLRTFFTLSFNCRRSAQGTYRFYSNARRFYSSTGNPLAVKGLRVPINKTIIPLALVEYEMIIANSALRASLAIYHLISNSRSWNNC